MRLLHFCFLTLCAAMLLLAGPVGWLVLFLSRRSQFWQLGVL
jgi:hypothetical protein